MTGNDLLVVHLKGCHRVIIIIQQAQAQIMGLGPSRQVGVKAGWKPAKGMMEQCHRVVDRVCNAQFFVVLIR